jgi:hypothetical protein
MAKHICLTAVLLAVSFGFLFAQETTELVQLETRVRGLPPGEIEAYVKGTNAYLPVVTFLTTLGIKAESPTSVEIVEGFLRHPDSTFRIDAQAGTGQCRGKQVGFVRDDYIVSGGQLYLRTKVIEDLLKLGLIYNPRLLIIDVSQTKGLPAVTAARRRRSLEQRTRAWFLPEPDYELSRDYSPLAAGRLDWSLSTEYRRELLGSGKFFHRYQEASGVKVFGGDFTTRAIGSVFNDRHNGNFQAQMRWAFLGDVPVHQLILGDFTTVGLLSHSTTGVEVTNRPANQRVTCSREVFRGKFEPQSEIYLSGTVLNPQLLQTDPLGDYEFDLPTFYGRNTVEVRVYDRWGQEQTLRYRVNSPRTILPPGEVEYSVAAGRVKRDGRFGVASSYLKYGASSFATIGGRADYYGQPTLEGKVLAGLTASVRPTTNVVLEGMAVPRAYTRLGASILLPENTDIQVEGVLYGKDEFVNPTNLKNSLEAVLYMPLQTQSGLLIVEAFGGRTEAADVRSWMVQPGLGFVISSISPRVSSRFVWRSSPTERMVKVDHQTIASIGAQLPVQVMARAEAVYDHLVRKPISFRADVVKSIHGFDIALSYLRLIEFQSSEIGLRVEYDFPFTRAGAGIRSRNNSSYEYTVSGKGSVSFTPLVDNTFSFFNRPNYVGSGGFRVHPFLDENANGIHDGGEASLERGRILMANATRKGRAGLATAGFKRFDRIPAYEYFDVHLDPQSLENPFWVPEYSTVRALSEPNYIRDIEFPIRYGGMIRGKVTIRRNGVQSLEGILVQLLPLRPDGQPDRGAVRTTKTFSTGDFEFGPVKAGAYLVELDIRKLSALGFFADPVSRSANVSPSQEGDVISNIDFELVAR